MDTPPPVGLNPLKILFIINNIENSLSRFTGSDVRVRDDGMPLAHVAIAVEGWFRVFKIRKTIICRIQPLFVHNIYRLTRYIHIYLYLAILVLMFTSNMYVPICRQDAVG